MFIQEYEELVGLCFVITGVAEAEASTILAAASSPLALLTTIQVQISVELLLYQQRAATSLR